MTEHDVATPWLTIREAAARAKCSTDCVYDAVKAGRLKAARLGVRNGVKIHADWLDAWITAAVIVNPHAPGDNAAVHPFRRKR